MSDLDEHLNKKTISIKRYRPLFDVLKVDVDDDWDDLKKMLAVLTGGDNVNHIKHCVKYELLTPLLVLQRIKSFAEKKEPFPFTISDLDTLYFELNQGVDSCLAGINELDNLPPKLSELLLLMFELGTQVGALNTQDLALKGGESIKQKHVAGGVRGEQKTKAGKARAEAYANALLAAQSKGFKPTAGGLRLFLKSLSDERYQTSVPGCEEIFLNSGSFVDTQGKYSESSLSSVIKALPNKNTL